jgi:hypothetical protein
MNSSRVFWNSFWMRHVPEDIWHFPYFYLVYNGSEMIASAWTVKRHKKPHAYASLVIQSTQKKIDSCQWKVWSFQMRYLQFFLSLLFITSVYCKCMSVFTASKLEHYTVQRYTQQLCLKTLSFLIPWPAPNLKNEDMIMCCLVRTKTHLQRRWYLIQQC